MKKYLLPFFSLITLMLLITSCQKDKKAINVNLKPVTNLTAPLNGSSFNLETSASNEFVFNWQTTQAEDGSLVLYEVLFDKEGGDFSKPVFTSLSDGKGVENKLTLSKAQFDKIAGLSGAMPLTSTNLIWTVKASKGWNSVLATEKKSVTITRMLPLPAELYVTGTGTEADAKKIKMTRLSEGVFEVFVKVKAGDIKFLSEDNSAYSLQLVGGSLKILSGATSTGLSGTQEKVLWVKIDFGAKNGRIIEVKQMGLWYCNANKAVFDLPYVGDGTWRKNGVPDFMSRADWTAREERYKYVMLINDGTGDKPYFINSFMGDPGGQDGAYPSSLDYRSINLLKNDGSQWDWGWKFDRNYITVGAVADYWVQMNSSEKYNQNYKKQ